jgi:hypothetical protein
VRKTGHQGPGKCGLKPHGKLEGEHQLCRGELAGRLSERLGGQRRWERSRLFSFLIAKVIIITIVRVVTVKISYGVRHCVRTVSAHSSLPSPESGSQALLILCT